MPNECLAMCCVCGFPASASALLRITWTEELKLVLAAEFKTNDSLVCEDCVRGIKALRFSEIDEQKRLMT